MSDFDKNSEKQCNDKSNNDNCENSLKKYFFSLPPKQFSLLSSLIGILLIDDLDMDQLNALGNFIVNIGQVILTAAAQSESLQNGNFQNDYIRRQIQTLKQQIDSLEKQLGS